MVTTGSTASRRAKTPSASRGRSKFSISNVPWTVRIWHRNGQVTDAHYPNIEEADMRAGIERGGNNTLDVRIFRA